MKKRVADIIMDTLIEQGIDTCFGVVGGGAMFLDNALLHCKNMRKIFNHHEQASAMAAEAYARLSGKIAVVCVTSGPGATNTLTGVLGAWQDSLPMVVLSGQVRYAISVPQSGLNLRYRGIQEYQIVPAVRHMTKYAVMITDPLSIKKELIKAVDIAIDGRRGPVWLDIPQDIQNAIVEENDLYKNDAFISEVSEISESDVNEVIDIMYGAERPCILTGTGIRSSNVQDLFLEFALQAKIPVIGASWEADNCYDEFMYYYGMSGNVGPRTGNFILQNADVVLTLGNSLGFRQTGFNLDCFAPNAKIIMVDACVDESKKPGLKIYKFVNADLRDFLEKANCYLKSEPDKTYRLINSDVYKNWSQYCDNLKKRFTPFEGADRAKNDGNIISYRFWQIFRKYEEDNSIVALGNNTGNSAKLQIGVQKKDQRVLTNYTCGSMGYDIPAAIGAAVAADRKVYCVTGDGSIMMNIQELQTIKGYDLPIHIIIFSNDGYNAIRQTSKNFFNGECIGCTPDTGVTFPDFKNIAVAFGFEYHRCEKNSDLDREIKRLTTSKHRILLELKQAFDDPVTPKVMSRIDEKGIMHTPALQDMYPFLNRVEYEEFMHISMVKKGT